MVRSIIAPAVFSLVVSCATVRAAEIVVKNDSVPPGIPVHAFHPAYRAGVRLTMPVNGTLVGVQVAWGSELGGAAPSQEAAIRISEAGDGDPNPYAPAATLATIDSPILIDGALNEFRYLDSATNLVALSVPVVAGATYFVDLEFLSDTDPAGFGEHPEIPSILADAILEDYSRDVIFIPNQGQGSLPPEGIWIPQALGLSGVGNFGIRAIINPVPEPSTLALAAVGLLGLIAAVMRKKRRHRGA